MTKLFLPDLAGTLENAFRVAGVSVKHDSGAMHFMDAEQASFVNVRGKNAVFGSTDDDGSIDILHGTAGTDSHQGRLNFSGGSYIREYEDPLTGGDADDFTIRGNQNITALQGSGGAGIAEHIASLGLFSYADGNFVFSSILDQIVLGKQLVVNAGLGGDANAGIIVNVQGSSGEALSWYNNNGFLVGGLNTDGSQNGFLLLANGVGTYGITLNGGSLASFGVPIQAFQDVRIDSGSVTNLDALRLRAVTAGTTIGIQFDDGTSARHQIYKDGATNDLVFNDLRYGIALRHTNLGVRIPSTFASTSTTDGALVVTGGVGVGGAMNVGGTIKRGSTTIEGSRLSLSSQGVTDTDSGIHIDRNSANGAGAVGGILLSQGSVSDRRLYLTGNDGGFYWNIGAYSTAAGELQVSNNQVGVAGAFRLAPDDTRAVRNNDSGTGLVIETGSNPGAHTAAADTAGYDTYLYTQSGGAHSAANPRGGDFVITTGAGGAGGTGRAGRVVINSQILATAGLNQLNFEALAGSPTISRLYRTYPELTTAAYNNQYLDVVDINTDTSGAVVVNFWQFNEISGSSPANDNSKVLEYNIDGTQHVGIYRNGKIHLGAGVAGHSASLYAQSTLNPMATPTTVSTANLGIVVANNSATNGHGTGYGFRVSGNASEIGAAIVHERTGGASVGGLKFATKSAAGSVIPVRMTLDEIKLHVLNTTGSTSTTDGSFVINGGMGLAENLIFGGVAKNTAATSTSIEIGDDTTSYNKFGGLIATPSNGTIPVVIGSTSNSSGSPRASLWSYSSHGDSNDNPQAVYGGIFLGRNNGSNSGSDMWSIGVWGQAAGPSNAGAGDKINVGVYGRATGGDINYAGYFNGDVYITGSIVSPLLYRSKVESINATGVLAIESNKKVIVKTAGITVSLWTIGVQDGDQVFIRNKSGGSITIDTEPGVSPQPTVEGVSSITRNDGEALFLVFDAAANDWTVF